MSGEDADVVSRPRWNVARDFREVVIIVLGILGAFAVDAAWDTARQREEEEAILTGLHEEFTSNLAHIQERLERHAGVDRSARMILRIARDAAAIQPDSLLRLIDIAATGWTANFQNGALEGVLQSGKLSLISDPELRRRLAGWSSRVDDYLEEERLAAVESRELHTPYMQRTVPRPETGLDVNDYATELRRLLHDLEFLNQVARRVRGTRAVSAEAARLIPEAEAILELISARR